MILKASVDIEYPESDGQPMGETDLHRDWMGRILDLLRYRYRGQRVYVSGNLLVYYEQGSPAKFIVPDVFVCKDVDPGQRRTYKLWEEHKAPDVVFEVTSNSSRREDTQLKPQVYSLIGVKEYFVYDPTTDYLDPPLQGFRLTQSGHTRIEADASGVLTCLELDLVLRLQNARLQICDRQTGAALLTEGEAERIAKEAALQRAASAEAELMRLRAELEKRDNA